MRTTEIKTAFILGAGLGTRLRPLTDDRPKPLLPVGGRPLITFALEHLASLGVERFIINTHHRAEVFAQVFPDGRWRDMPILFRYEPELLDTAGGLKNIEDLLEHDRTLIVYNGDVVSDLPLGRLVARHAASDAEVTLALRSKGSPLNVNINARHEVCDLRHTLGNPGVQSCLFTGIYVVEKKFLARIAAGQKLSVIEVFLDMIRKKTGTVAGVVIDEGSWRDIGSPAEYHRINDSLAGEAVQTTHGPDWEMEPFVRSILGLPEKAPLSLSPLARGGSARSFYRADCGDRGTVIFMRYAAAPAENTRYAAIAGFLAEIGVTVPRILVHDETRRFLVMEDLGERDLWSFRQAPWQERRGYYLKTLALARRLHSFPLKDFPAGITLAEGFTPALYRWERDYFREHFVAGFCRIAPDAAEQDALEKELQDLAGRLAKGPRGLVHRDLQSQNVMLRNGAPVLIDFQGMRFGNPCYDLGSLLCDPYVAFTDTERLELLSSYHELLPPEIKWEEFTEQFWMAAAQRLMQALGAYGYLGLKQNKPGFLAHIPAGLTNLIAAAGHANLPRLRELALACLNILEK